MDVFVRYPTDSIVDIDDVTNKLTNGNNFQGEININITSNQTDLRPDIVNLRRKNASLFWGLIIFCLVVVIIIIVIICCNCCPGCYYYNENDRKKRKTGDLETNTLSDPTQDPEITVLTVKNERGEDLKDAKFVEIIKSAKNRIRSAISRGSSANQQVDATHTSNTDNVYGHSLKSRLFKASRRPRI